MSNAANAGAGPATTNLRAVGTREPIAIVGIGCRFPGVRDVDGFWRMLVEGRETIGDYPGGRFPYIDQCYDPSSPLAGRIATRRGGFLHELDRFDAEFFGVSPREAALLDPQQRLLLEVAWEAIDDAGLRREQVAGKQTGVFVGMWTSDYETCVNEASAQVDLYATTGTGRYSASGRLAFVLDARGPNLTLDTACSSSLVTLHLACQSLWNDECEIALAGGVNIMLRPEITMAYSRAKMLSPDAQCKFGDASANGYVRSEGAGMVLVKRLSRALADGDPIYATVRGTAVNNDGRSSGLLVAPSSIGQEEVFQAALERAGVSPADLDYVEAHGTGTLRGDPVELEAIGQVLKRGETPRERPCLVGSVKTNFGHTEAAAGVAGIIKVALSLHNQMVPATLHLHEPNPNIPWDSYPIEMATKSVPWPTSTHAPLAAVCGFGITGTNANAILEGAPPRNGAAVLASTPPIERPSLFLLSGHTPEALTASAQGWLERLQGDPQWPTSLTDLAYTAAVRRTQHEFRLALPARNRRELEGRLAAWVAGEEQPAVASGRQLEHAPSRAVFVYPGQGGQWVGMGRTLFEREPAFQEALLRCDEAIAKHVGWSVVDALLEGADSTKLGEIDVVQPALFAVMIALTELWRSLGVQPAAVVGHSMGEAAAAAVAGALSLDDAAAVICHRSRLMKQVRGRGLMAVVELSLDDTRALTEDPAANGRVWVGASNGATSTVISGDTAAVETVVAALEAREIFCRRIQVDVASHSGHMDLVRGELEAALAHIRPRKGELPMYSTTTGEIEDGSRLDAAYWGKNLRQPVLFYPAVERLLNDGYDAFVEINAHPVLTHSLADSIQNSGRDAVVIGSLRRDSDEQEELLGRVGALHAAGYPVDLQRLFPKGSCLRLPTYPWQRERHWFEPTGALSWKPASSRQGAESDSTATEPVAAECLYDMQWVAAPVDEKPAPAEAGHWIVLADGETGTRLATELTALGDTCTLIQSGSGPWESDAVELTADPTSEDDLRKILVDQIGTCRGIIHAWSISERDGEPNLQELWNAQSLGCFSAAALLRVIIQLNPPRPVRLWLVTGGVQQLSSERDAVAPTFPTHGALFGLGRAIAEEHPEVPCTNLDLSAEPQDDELRAAARLIKDDTTEQQMLVRGTQRLVARYRRARETQAEAPTIRADGSYLITGGLGGLGLLTAQWLVTRGARSLVLVGRKAPSADALRVIGTLETAGATVRVVSADIADTDQVAHLLATIQTEALPIRGVLHLAATVDDALLADASEENYERLLRPKMAGAWNLYQSLRGNGLDFWVSFSSIATVVNQPGQGSYAAANAFLDGLARYATARGERMQSLQWGPWAGMGLANERGTQRSFQAYTAQGIQSMPPELGIAMLGQAITLRAPVMLAAAIDWRTFVASWTDHAGVREFADLVPVAAAAPRTVAASTAAAALSDMADSAVPDLREQLAAVAPGRPRTALIEQHLREQLAAVLKTSPNRVDLQKPMGSMGVDSLMALELVRRLSRSIGVKVPATAVFNYPTITKLAAMVETRMDGARGAPVQPTASSTSPASAETNTALAIDVHALSDEDALRALTGEPGANR